uniref:Uncharacterized protein n=1 Tax=viral metagenome TaxID=1070528 RepID=A0A6M3LEU9_9ZZZZ
MIVNDIIKKLKDEPCDDPKVISDYLIQLSASLYTATEMEADLEVGYCRKWEEIRNSAEMTDKMAEMKAKQTEAWRDWRTAKNTNITIIEVIRALKRKLRNLEIIYNENLN